MTIQINELKKFLSENDLNVASTETVYQIRKQTCDTNQEHIADKSLIFALNNYLDHVDIAPGINENIIRNLLSILDHSNNRKSTEYWLLIARIAEMALFCAGNYADSCEFCAAGDILVNPQKILIHIRDRELPLQKNRHGKISEQLNPQNEAMEKFIGWFRKNVMLQVCQKSLMDDLFCRMEKSKQFTNHYLVSIQKRMNKVSDTIGFLFSWQIKSSQDFHEKFEQASPETKIFIQENLCNFDLKVFNRIGEDIKRLQKS